MIIPNPQYFVFFIFLFIITSLIVNRYLVNPLFTFIREREKLLLGTREEARRKREEGIKILKEVNEKIEITRSQAQEKVREIIEGASRTEKEIIIKARIETKSQIDRVKEDIEREIEIAKRELMKEIDAMAIRVVEKLLGRKI